MKILNIFKIDQISIIKEDKMLLPKIRTTDIIVQKADKELLIYDLNTHKAYNLNLTAKIVYNACDGKTDFDDLKSKHKFTDDLIYFALDELKINNLIAGSYQSKFVGISRRDVIKLVGLASMITLPIISTLIAPKAVNAQSFANLALGQTCSSSAQCSSSVPNCSARSPSTGSRRCCAGSVSYYDTGSIVNSCSGGSSCNSANFACQSDAGMFCCSNSATASCSTANSCACRCN